MKFTDKRVAL